MREMLAAVLERVPRPLRDGVYDLVARTRYRLLGRRRRCLLVDREARRRYVP